MIARRKSDTAMTLREAAHRERQELAAKVRAARAILRWSQAELGRRVGLTQRSINRLEHGKVDSRRSTAVAIEIVFKKEGVTFEAKPEGGFRILVSRRVS